MDQLNLGAWIDRTDTLRGGVPEQQARLVHAVLGKADEAAPEAGEVMPPLWHWYAFPPAPPMRDLGPDGHPRLGDFMPPLRLNRRMWAGGNLEFFKPLHVGEPLRRRTRISNIMEKQAGAGEMVIVSLDHEIHGQSGLAVLERQDIVYLQIPDRYVPPKAIRPEEADLAAPVTLSSPLLFRYSAITFNAHRIHYDLLYTHEIEHYPDLVVHGPLQAQLLMNFAVAERGSTPAMFTYRGVHPLFLGNMLELRARKQTASDWSLCAVADGAHQTMQANAIWEI